MTVCYQSIALLYTSIIFFWDEFVLEVIFLPELMIGIHVFFHTIFASVSNGQCLDQVFPGSSVLFKKFGWGVCIEIAKCQGNFIHRQINSTEQICYQERQDLFLWYLAEENIVKVILHFDSQVCIVQSFSTSHVLSHNAYDLNYTIYNTITHRYKIINRRFSLNMPRGQSLSWGTYSPNQSGPDYFLHFHIYGTWKHLVLLELR